MVRIKKPIIIHYKFFAKDKAHDRSNIASAFAKSFEDAMQELNIIKNDGWNDVVGFTFDFDVDKGNPRVHIVIEELSTTKIKDFFDWKEFEK